MTTLKLNLCGRDLNPNVNYINPNQQISLSKEGKVSSIEETVFMVENLKKEVKFLNPQQLNRIKKTLKIIQITSVSILGHAMPVFAATTGMVDPTFMKDLKTLIFTLVTIALLITAGLAIICLVLAGGYRMLRKKKEATEWTTDIIKGLIQAVTAPVIVGLIIYLATKLFGNSEWFISPF